MQNSHQDHLVVPFLTAESHSAAQQLMPRIDAAIQRIVNGQGCMRIPADMEDPDLVLADCRRLLKTIMPILERAQPSSDSPASGGTGQSEKNGCSVSTLQARITELEEALREIAAIEDQMYGPDWEEIAEARNIARAALKEPGND